MNTKPMPIRNWASSRKYIFSTDHKIIGIQFLFSSVIFLLVGGALALLVRIQLAWPHAEIPILRDWFPDNGGRMPRNLLQHALQHARLGHDLLRHHSVSDRGVRQLHDSADDRGQGHGVSDAEHDVVLVHVARVRADPGQLLRRGGRPGRGLDFLSDAVQHRPAARPGRAIAGRPQFGAWARSTGWPPCCASASPP